MSKDKKSNYYDVGGIETIAVIKAKLTVEQYRGYLMGNALKYLTRMNFKGDQKRDAEKASNYVKWLVESYGRNAEDFKACEKLGKELGKEASQTCKFSQSFLKITGMEEAIKLATKLEHLYLINNFPRGLRIGEVKVGESSNSNFNSKYHPDNCLNKFEGEQEIKSLKSLLSEIRPYINTVLPTGYAKYREIEEAIRCQKKVK